MRTTATSRMAFRSPFRVLLGVLMAFAVAACGSGSPAATSGEAGGVEELTVELATWGSPDHVNLTSFLPTFEEELQTSSDGRIQLEHLSGGSLAEDVDMPVAIPAGTVTMGWSTVNGWSGVVPEVAIFDSPSLQLTRDELEATLDDENGLGGVLNERFREQGALVLAWSDLGPAIIVSGEEIRVPSDLAGKSVRVFSEGGAEVIEAAGGIPVTIAFAEVYTALQRGTVDAAHTGLQGVQSQQLQEVTSHGIVPATFLGTAVMGWIVNLDWWESLSEESREAIAAAAEEAEDVAAQALQESREQLIAQYEEQGMEIFVLTPDDPEYSDWQALVEPLAERDRERFDPAVIEAIESASAA